MTQTSNLSNAADHHYTEISRQYDTGTATGITGVLRVVHENGISSRDELWGLIDVAVKSGIEPGRISDELGYSASSVYRWVHRESAPHKSLWPVLTEWIVAALQQKVADLGQLGIDVEYTVREPVHA